MGRCSFFTITFFAHHLESGKFEKISYRWYKIPKVLNFVSVRTEFYPTMIDVGVGTGNSQFTCIVVGQEVVGLEGCGGKGVE